MPVIENDGKVKLWGCPLFANIEQDGWIVEIGGQCVWNTYEEAEEAAKKSIFRLQTIRIQ